MFPEEKGSSDEEEGEEEEEEVTRDGTLLASEPARPLYVATYFSCFKQFIFCSVINSWSRKKDKTKQTYSFFLQ